MPSSPRVPNNSAGLSVPDRKEWDFRGIEPGEALRAGRYEYARDLAWLGRDLAEWQQELLGKWFRERQEKWASEIADELGEWAEKPIGRILREKRFDMLPDDIQHAIRENTPARILDTLGPLAWWFPEFPQAYQELTPDLRRERIQLLDAKSEDRRKDLPRASKAFHVERAEETAALFKDSPLEIAMRNREAEAGVFYVRIDLGFGLRAINEALGELARTLTREQPRRKVRTGKAAAPDAELVKLKWLAARRLHRAGITNEWAMSACDSLRRATGDSYSVLPRFSDNAAWSHAVKDSKEHERRLFGALADY